MDSSKSRIHLSDCISALQFNCKSLEHLFITADKIRSIQSSKPSSDKLQELLSDKRAVLYFAQPSTRTFLSFANACHILGIKISDIRSSESSSESKGESVEDTVRTMASYSDLIIIRHYLEDLYPRVQNFLKKTGKSVPIINAGLGTVEHPTQALLDLYTLYRAFKGKLDGKTIALVGDLKRGRTIRSLTYLLSNYHNINLIYISPQELSIKEDISDYLNKNKITFTQTIDFNKYISEADVIYMTRIQDEYDKDNESKSIDYDRYSITTEHLKLLKKNAVILHPLPRRKEIDPAIDTDKRALYWEQEENGMWLRAALIANIFGIDKKILKLKKKALK